MQQASREFVNRSASFQKNSLAIEYQSLGFPRDRLFFGAIAAAERLVGRLKIRARGARNSPAMRADQHAFLLQGFQVAADGGCGDAECANQFGGGDRSLASERLADAKSPFLGQQAHQTSPSRVTIQKQPIVPQVAEK